MRPLQLVPAVLWRVPIPLPQASRRGNTSAAAAKMAVEYPVDDEQLVGRLALRDESALATLYDRFSGAVFVLLVRIVDDRQIAEDLLQEAFIRAWQHAGTYQPARGRVHSWLLGIAQNLAFDELRRRRRRPQVLHSAPGIADEIGALPNPTPDLAESTWTGLRRAQLLQALDTLPQAQRDVIALYAQGYSQSEIAHGLKEPLGTIKTRLRRGFLALRGSLERAGYDER